MSVDIEQWRAGIGNFNGRCQYPVARIKLRVCNIFSAVVMSACVFLLILFCFSNLNTILHFLLVSSVFTFSPSVLELLVHKIFCLKINILLYCIGPVSYIDQKISYTRMLNTISFFNVLYFTYFLHLLLLQHGDIERNPGPKSGQIKNLSCCHWNVNSLVVQHLSKRTQLEAYSSLYKHDFICISETYFDSSILEGDSSFQLDGYKVIRADHPSNTKRGGICIYYKETLSVRALNLTNLNECIICQVSVQNCKGYIGVIYRSPSQSTAEFE